MPFHSPLLADELNPDGDSPSRPLCLPPEANAQQVLLPADLRRSVVNRLAMLCAMKWHQRLWHHDASLWTGQDEDQWLGWLNPYRQKGIARRMAPLCASLRTQGWTDAVLIGMGGASLGAYVLSQVLGTAPGGLRLHVLDSTDPAQVRELEARIPLARTLFIIASKSGSTLETTLLEQHFLALARALEGDRAPRRFCAITDAGSPLDQRARQQGYAAVFNADRAIGGRYSVLSPFGMVPLALMGHDPCTMLHDAEWMSRRCGPGGGGEPNDALWLGTVLGEAAIAGRNKVTLCTSSDLSSLGEWLEQLLAESTGKGPRALIPICGEQPDALSEYRPDRVFVFLLGPRAHPQQWRKEGRALARAGHPVVFIDVASDQHLGQEFYRWEYATAVAATLLGVHPFDQPDVEATKVRTRRLIQQAGRSGPQALPNDDSGRVQRYYSLLIDVGENQHGSAPSRSLEDGMREWLASPGVSYHAILGYLPRIRQTESWLSQWQYHLRELCQGAVVADFGPRYLHSCGQLHKGGPACGAFLFLRSSHACSGIAPTLDALYRCHEAQARADLLELRSRGRPCVSVRMTGTLTQGLRDLSTLLRAAWMAQYGAASSAAPGPERRGALFPRPGRRLSGVRADGAATTVLPPSWQTPAETGLGA